MHARRRSNAKPSVSRPHSRRLRLEALEPRVLLSGNPLLQLLGDGVGPRVTALTPEPSTTAPSATTVVVTLDGALDPATVNDTTVRLTASGGDGAFADGNEVPVPGAVIYNDGAQTIAFTPSGLLGGDTYQLWLDGTGALTDADGDPLDGEYAGALPSGNGSPGGDFEATFSVNVPQIQGNYTADTAWAAGTWYLYNDLTIQEGVTLTIHPGVVVKGRYYYDQYGSNDVNSELHVSGTLDAQGTAEHPIIFTSIHDDWHGGDTNGNGSGSVPAAGDWGTIHFWGTNTNCVLAHAEILYGGRSTDGSSSTHTIAVWGESTPVIHNNTIRYGRQGAIYMQLTANPDIAGNTIQNHPINGVWLENTTMQSSNVWDDTDVVYYMYNDIAIAEGATLTISPGMIIKGRYLYDQYGSSDVNSELHVRGTLHAQGTVDQPIVFTSINDDQHGGDTNNNGNSTAPGSGDWGTIQFWQTSTDCVLEYAHILYAGRSTDGSSSTHTIAVWGATTPSIRNNVIRYGRSAAIYMQLAANPSISGNTIEYHPINGVQLESGTMQESNAWDDPDVTYYMHDDIAVAAGATLTIVPGMVMKGRRLYDQYGSGDVNAELIVSGTLVAQGTEEQPIVFTSISDDQRGGDTNNDGNGTAPAAGDWGGIRFGGTSPDSVLEHAEVLYAGRSTDGASATYTISVWGQSTPAILNSTIWFGLSGAIYLELGANPDLSGNAISGHPVNGVLLQGGTLLSSNAWDDPDVVYYMENDIAVAEGVILTIAPGMIIKGRYQYDQYGSNDVNSELTVDGVLIADGTPQQPIVFTSIYDDQHGGDTNGGGRAPLAGDWGGLNFSAAAGDTSVLDHVQVWYAGRNYDGSSSREAVRFTGASPDLTNGVVRNCLQNGLTITDHSYSTISNTVFAYCSGTALHASSGSTPTLINNTFHGNSYAVVCDGTGWTVLRNNIIANHSGTAVTFRNGATGQLEYNLFFDNGGHTSGISPDPIGQDGNVVGDPLFLDLSVGDFRLRDGSPAIDAATSIGAPALDQSGNVRYDDPNVENTGFGIFPYYDIGAFERQQPSRPIDLIVENVLTLPTASVNDPVPVQFTVRNIGENPAPGSWTDAVFLSTDATWSPDDRFMGSITHHGGLEPGRTYDAGLAVDVPGAIEGDYYLIVKTDHGDDLRSHVVEVDEQNNWDASDMTTLSVPELALGSPEAGQFEGDGVARYYKVVVADGMTLHVELDDADDAGADELYVRREAVPTRSQYDARAQGAFDADLEAWVGDTQAGTYYILVYGDYVPNAPAGYSIRATTLGFGVASVTPSQLGNSDHAVVVIQGSAFADDAQVLLRRQGAADIVAGDVVVADRRFIQATFDLSGVATGAYDLIIVQGGQDHVAMQGFQIAAASTRELSVGITGPRVIRLGRTGTFTVTVTNDGNTTIPYLVTELGVPQECSLEPVTFTSPSSWSESVETTIDPTVQKPDGSNAGHLLVRNLAPGRSASFDVKVRNVSGGGHQTLTTQAKSWILTDVEFSDWYTESMNNVRADVLANPSDYSPEMLQLAQNDSDWAATVAASETALEETLTEEEFIEEAATAAEWMTFVGMTGAGCLAALAFGPIGWGALLLHLGAHGIVHFAAREQLHEFWVAIMRSASITPLDPNDKVGSGYGDAGYVLAGQELPYTIHFENLAAATASAQEILITDQLDVNLDWSTFELREIGFGEHVIEVPDGLPHWEGDVDLGDGLIARVNAGLDIQSGVFTTQLVCLDAMTGLFPEDPLAGLLPPNDEPPEGEGWVTFRVGQQPGLAHGTTITNKAAIVFDTNPPIETNEVTNTIDTNLPTSAVDPLPAEVSDMGFEVSWSGDDGDGAGVQGYTVYVSEDGAPFGVWLPYTTESSAMYAPEPGHTYSFYSIARDHVGNEEPEKTAADPGATATTFYSQLRVWKLETTVSGIVAHVTRPVEASLLNLYDDEAGSFGAPDATLVGDSVGPIAGSVVYDDEAGTLTFVKTATATDPGLLEPDTYTLTIRSAADGVQSTDGKLLDGDADGADGGDYVATFTVDALPERVLYLPDVVRGPGQDVTVPLSGDGLTVRLSEAGGVQGINFTVAYDPALLEVHAFSPAAGLPADWALVTNTATAGTARVAIYGTTPLPGGPADLVTIDATVPTDAPYGGGQALRFDAIELNEGALAAAADTAVHVAAYFGDATGNHDYSALDASYIARVSVGLDTGFAAYPLKDPVLIADVTGNGQVTALDASDVARKSVGLPVDTIPDIPPGVPPLIQDGPDPLISISPYLSAMPGESVVIPLEIDDATGLRGTNIELAYDTTRVDAASGDVQAGGLTGSWGLVANVDDAAGLARIALYDADPLPGGAGSLVVIEATVPQDATEGYVALDLQDATHLNEGELATTLSDGILRVGDIPALPGLVIDTEVFDGLALNVTGPGGRSLGIDRIETMGNGLAILYAAQIGSAPDAGWLRLDGNHVFADGSGPDWHTASEWAGKRLGGLEPDTAYSFRAIASDGQAWQTPIIDVGIFSTTGDCDINDSGLATALDYAYIRAGLLRGTELGVDLPWCLDVDGDGDVDGVDLSDARNRILNPEAPAPPVPAIGASALATSSLVPAPAPTSTLARSKAPVPPVPAMAAAALPVSLTRGDTPSQNEIARLQALLSRTEGTTARTSSLDRDGDGDVDRDDMIARDSEQTLAEGAE